MPERNVELPRRWSEALNARDIEAVIALCDPSGVFISRFDAGRWTGLAGMTEGLRGFLSAWEEFRAEAEKYRELDDERVLVLVRFSGRGKKSGLEVEQMQAKGATLYHVRDGKVTRLFLLRPRARARRSRLGVGGRVSRDGFAEPRPRACDLRGLGAG